MLRDSLENVMVVAYLIICAVVAAFWGAIAYVLGGAIWFYSVFVFAFLGTLMTLGLCNSSGRGGCDV